jgi:hypothetical protein
MTRSRLYLFRFLALAASLIVCESSLRIYRHVQVRRFISGGLRPSDRPGLVYEGVPNCKAGVLTNSRGYPDRQHSLAKPPGVFRIVAIGDSVAAGYPAGWQTSFPRLLENKHVEVVFLGQTGYCTAQELVLLESEAFAYHPDLILWCYCLNDPDPNSNGHLSLLERPRSYLADLLGKVWRESVEHLRTWNGPQEYVARLFYLHGDEAQRDVATVGRICQEHHVPAAFFVCPAMDYCQSWDQYPLREIHKRLLAAAKAAGMTPLDGLDAFAGHAPDDVAFASGDAWHFSLLGHRLVAAYLQKQIPALR